ncbi:MAG: phosphopantetheine-binding protein [Candidatus Acidiferrales bacterium]
MEDPIQEKVLSAVRTVAHQPYAELPLNTGMEFLAKDSIDQVSLLFELEELLGIDIPDHELTDHVKTLGDLVEKMRRLSAAAVPRPAATEPRRCNPAGTLGAKQ